MNTIASWLGGLAFVVAALGGTYLAGYSKGAAKTEATWQEKLLIAERTARQTEADLRGIIEESGRRTAERERVANEQARKKDQYWRATLARVPPCPIPHSVGVQLDTASGVSAAAAVAEPPRAAAADPAPDAASIELAATLDIVRENYSRCAITVGRLTDAQAWYNAVRDRINGSTK